MARRLTDGSEARFAAYVEGLTSVIGHADRVAPLEGRSVDGARSALAGASGDDSFGVKFPDMTVADLSAAMQEAKAEAERNVLRPR